MNTRKTTNRLLEMVEDHIISPMDAVQMCLNWMSEDDVKEMCRENDIFPEEEDEEDEDEEVSAPYLLFGGRTKDDLYPMSSWLNKDEAIAAAKIMVTSPAYKCGEVVYMPEDDDDINEVVWTNCGRK